MSAETALWSRDSWESAPDDVLLTQARDGSAEAFGELWRRHLPAAYGVAGKHGGRTPAEDIVAEAATKIFTLLQAGRGPDEHFRAYFLTTVRTVAADHTRRELRLLPVSDDDLELLAEPADGADGGDIAGGVDGGADGGDADRYDTELVRAAFTSLPERDQTVLWHTTVEGEAPRVVAPRLGMTAAAVSSRAMRAREALRAGYLDAYAERCLANAESRECSWTIERLGRLVRGRLPRRQTERAEAHIASCPHAAAVVTDLREIHRGFPALVVPLVLAVGFGSSGLAAALGFAGVGAAGAGAGAAALAAMGEAPGGAVASAGGTVTGGGAVTDGGAVTGGETTTGAGGGVGAEGAGGTGGEGVGAATESSQLASRLAVALAAGVVALGLVAAALTSGQSDVPAPPAAAAPGGPGSSPSVGADGAPTTAATSSPPTPSSTPTTSATSTATLTSAGATSSVAGTSSAPRVTSSRPAPPPTSSPAPALPPASGVAARLLGSGDPSRISLRVPGASTGGSLTVTVSTASGAGSLTAGNRTFACRQSSRSSLTCVGDGGQIQLVQSGTGGPAPLVVRVRDASGAVTQSVVVPS